MVNILEKFIKIPQITSIIFLLIAFSFTLDITPDARRYQA